MFKELVKPEVAICLQQVKSPQDHETTPTAPQASACRLAVEAEIEEVLRLEGIASRVKLGATFPGVGMLMKLWM